MNAGLLHGLWTALLLAAFLAIVVWAWSSRRKPDFDEAARLPLEDDGPLPDVPARVASHPAVARGTPAMDSRCRGNDGDRTGRRKSSFPRKTSAPAKAGGQSTQNDESGEFPYERETRHG